MDFDHCVYQLYEIARSDEGEISSCFHQLAFDVSKNGIPGLVPAEDGGIEDGVPFQQILATLQSGMDQTSSKKDRERMEKLYQDLFAECVDGYR
ncbi:hypothetical protein B6S41_01575 [Enterococcus faecalis]|nr:hypothetical protein [Enterococcus faecalis]OSM25625.1 hypothetical protein B6S39_00550 [Enterococcus faecalis]OSM28824.1 hypothetical protein B6S41_01575 [Enterococcus faecalis]WPH48021.1 hypothetical protein SHT67_05610 [Enterococcus faecalis]